MTIGSRIKIKRKELGYTLEEVGNAVGVEKSTVKKWEDGHIANMRVDKIEALATALKTTPAYLMGWEERTFNSDAGDYKTVLSTTIKHYREAANFSYADLSRLTDIPKATLHRYETNPTQKIPAASVLAIEKALSLSPGTLMLQNSIASSHFSNETCSCADRIRIALDFRKMSQTELCQRTGIPKSAMSQYLKGSFKPKQNRIYAMAQVLNVSEAWLRGYDVAMIPHTAELSPQESNLIEAYRKHPEVRLAVHRLLMIEQPENE